MATQPQTVTIAVSYHYIEAVIPPRCRKPRYQDFTDTLTVQVPVVASEDAPVVMRLPLTDSDDDPRVIELRGWNGDLYEPMTTYSYPNDQDTLVVQPGSSDYPLQVTASGINGTKAEASAEIRERYAAHLIIDERVWTRTIEPGYEVMTYGFGRNHGGTSLRLARHPRREMDTHPVTDRTEAIRHATQVATQRGDTNSLAGIAEVAAVEVLLPSCVARPSLEVIKTSKEIAMLEQIAKVKAILDDTTDGRAWRLRIEDAGFALQEARDLAAVL